MKISHYIANLVPKLMLNLLLIFFAAVVDRQPRPAVQEARGRQEVGKRQQRNHQDQGEARQVRVDGVDMKIPDPVIVDQEGKRVRFYSDLIRDKTVVISFFYSTCQNICVNQGDVLSGLQSELGKRLGKEVFIISVTTDPETDTPDRLKQWGRMYALREGWTLVTGRSEEVRKIVGAMTGDPLGRRELHAASIYLANDKKSIWTTAYGLADPKELVKKIDELSYRSRE